MSRLYPPLPTEHNGCADIIPSQTSKKFGIANFLNQHSKGETMQRRIALLSVLIFTLTVFAACQKPSPAASASCDLGGGKSIKTAYSSPRMKGRKIYGGLVPFGEVWRTGANEATTFVTSADVNVGGKTVPAGSYTIFTIPAADKWTLIVNKKTGEWGIPYTYKSDELARIDM